MKTKFTLIKWAALLPLALNLSLFQSAQAASWATNSPLGTARSGHTATLLPNGTVLAAGGNSSSIFFSSAEVFDPATGFWNPTGSMTTSRSGHTATLLPNGKVLVTGGYNVSSSTTLSSAELYDPGTRAWSATGSMATTRAQHTATLLPNGKVLVAGGHSDGGVTVNSAELYDPATGTWSVINSMNSARRIHAATLLPNGKVLVAGGYDGTNYLAKAELYDPATGNWTVTGAMKVARCTHGAVLLPNGKVLVAGGYGTSYPTSAEIYDPAGETWSSGGSMSVARQYISLTLLPNGKVLAAGGVDVIATESSAEMFDPIATNWTSAGVMSTPHAAHTATLLPGGNVLVAAGYRIIGFSGVVIANTEVYDSGIGAWTAANPMAVARTYHSATLLPNGKVLVAGGVTNNAIPAVPTASAELFDPALGTWSPTTNPMVTQRFLQTATLLANGKVLVAGGGTTNFFTLASTELYDPATGTWTVSGSMHDFRQQHAAALLRDGTVLVCGGYGLNVLSNAELYTPASGTWTMTGSMTSPRMNHTLTLLPDGKVLAVGGEDNTGYAFSAELYDPATGTWLRTSNTMNFERDNHTATLLPSGKVLIEGMISLTAELFDPASESWTETVPMNLIRPGRTATLLSNGKVLVAGGYSPYADDSEIFDPAAGTWTTVGSLLTVRSGNTATLLPNGNVLIVGGAATNGDLLASAELFDVGLGYSNLWQPQIATLTSPLSPGGSLAITGSGFRGISEGSGGNGGQDSPSDYPVVQLRSLENEQTMFLLTTNWSTNSFVSLPVTNFASGWALATVFVNGIPSPSRFLMFGKLTATLTLSNLLQAYDGRPKHVSTSTAPPGLSVTVTYNGSGSAPYDAGSYPVVGTINDPGYQGSAAGTLVITPLISERHFGVDASHYQGSSGISQASWNQMFTNGQRFAFIKATEGLTGPDDPTMATNLQGAKAAGLLAGVYHFAHPENRPTPAGAVQEADHLLAYAGSAVGPDYLRPVLDVETIGVNQTAADLTDWVIAFSNEIAAQRGANAAPIIYCDSGFAVSDFDSRLSSFDLWVASPPTGDPATNNPPTGVFNNWSFWQYTAGSSGGILSIDLDVCHDEFKPLGSFLIPGGTPVSIVIAGTTMLPGGAFQFTFSNTPGAGFSVLTATNLSSPLSNWTILGPAIEVSAGQFQFADPQATNNPQRFYRIRSP